MEHKQISCGSIVPTISPKYPWFVADDDDTQTHVFFNLHDPFSHYHFKIPELLGKRIRGCFFGCWALLSTNNPSDVMWSLWNPITSQIINFPPLILEGSERDKDDIIYSFCLSAPPDHPNSVLLLLRSKNHKFVYCRLGSDSFLSNARKRKELRWTEMTYAKQIRSITGCDGWLHSLTYYNGKVYAGISVFDNIMRVFLVEVHMMFKYHKRKKRTQVVITLLPILELPLNRTAVCCACFVDLKGSCTELFSIQINITDSASMTVGSVNVFKLDMDNKTWEEIDDLKDTMITMEFDTDLSPVLYSSAIASSEFGGYVHIFCDKGKIINSYNVKDKTFSLSSGPCCLAGSNHLSVWEIPECTRLEDAHAQIVERSVKCDDEVNFNCTKDDSHLLLPTSGYKCRLESDHAESEQEDDMHNDIIVRPVNGNEDELHLLNIPLHVLEVVMEFCVDVKYLMFRSTCKLCHSAAPTSHDWLVVALTSRHVFIYIVSGEPSRCNVILDLYAMRADGGLDVYKEMGREILCWERYVGQAPTSCCTSLPQSFQVRCEQHFLQVIVGKFGESVEVFKLEVSTQEWVKINDLGKHVISISIASSLCIEAKIPEMENKIYFPRLSSESRNMVFYSLETCRLESDHAESEQEDDMDKDIIARPVNGDEDELHLLNIPLHVLEVVMEFCVGVEYLKFRSTCKLCHSAAPLIQCNNGKASKWLQTYSLLSPWLMVFDKHRGVMTFTDPMFGDKYFIKTSSQLICDFEIKCARYGWLLILKPDDSLVFFNPFTSDVRELPELSYESDYCFSAPPTSPDCMVVALARLDVFIYFVSGEPSWRHVRLDLDDDLCSYPFLTLYGHDLFATRADGRLDVYKEMGREDLCWERYVVPAPTSCCTSFPQSYQVRCDEHILHVIVGMFGETVEVFKLNSSTQEWVKIDNLGKRMIFISSASSLCIEAKIPQMENKICFPRLFSESGNMVFYSLETCRYHTINNKIIQEEFVDFFGTKHFLTPHSWIEPSCC